MIMKWILCSVCFMGLLLMSGCHAPTPPASNDISVDVASNSQNPDIFVASVGGYATATYDIHINNAGNLDLSNLSGQTFTVNFSGLSAPFSITQNNCQNIALDSSCSITVKFSPNSTNNDFDHANLIASVGDTSTSTPLVGVGPMINVPVISFGNDNKRTGINVAVGGGADVNAMFDTGSSPLVVEKSYVGPNIRMTNQSIAVAYDGVSMVGTLGYASAEIGDSPYLVTSVDTPVIVVPDNSLYPSFDAHAVLGVGLETTISARLYLPYPFNQMMLIDKANNQVGFGSLNSAQVASFNAINLQKSDCEDYGIVNNIQATCWNDRLIPVTYTIVEPDNSIAQIVIGTVFDTGEYRSTLVSPSTPSWAIIFDGLLINPIISATLANTSDPINIPLSANIAFYDDPTSSLRFNSGPEIFDQYQFLYDQVDGIIGLK